jgi:hypothetical protein
MFGVMFAPRAEVAVSELLRVCRPGGCIALANWTPDGLMGRMSAIAGRYFPPSPLPPATRWGEEAAVRDRFGEGVSEIRFTRRLLRFQFDQSVPDTIAMMRRYVGPMQRAFASLDTERQSGLNRDLVELWTSHNRAADGTTEAEAEYLEVVATRR